MSILELKEQLLRAQDELETIIANGEKEQRELVEDETNRMSELRKEIEGLNSQISEEERKNEEIIKNKTERKNMKNSNPTLFSLIKGVVENNLTDEQRAYVNGNQINFRSAAENGIAATVATAGKENVPEDKMRLEVAIRNASVLNKIGATWFGNAVGNIRIPKYDGSNVYWADSENAEAQDGKQKFSEVSLSPKRLTAYITISRQFLAQSPEDAEAILISDLAAAVAEKLDKTVFGTAAGTDAQPAGLFTDGAPHLVTGKTIDSITFNDVLELEEAVEEKNATDFIFVADPKVKYALRGTQMASGLQFVWDNGEIDGRKAVVSNSVAQGGLLCFDPKALAVATWDNGMFITVDPYTLAGKNQIKVTVNYLVDATLKGDSISGAIFK